jgi:hypothetical protein
MGCRYSSQRTPWWGGYGGCRQGNLASIYVVKLRLRAVFANEQFLCPVARPLVLTKVVTDPFISLSGRRVFKIPKTCLSEISVYSKINKTIPS